MSRQTEALWIISNDSRHATRGRCQIPTVLSNTPEAVGGSSGVGCSQFHESGYLIQKREAPSDRDGTSDGKLVEAVNQLHRINVLNRRGHSRSPLPL